MKKGKYLIGILSLLFLCITILVTTGHISSLDEGIYESLIAIRNDFWDTFFKTITVLGNTTTIISIMVLLLVILKRKDYYVLLATVLTTVCTNQILKHIIRRIRPSHIRLIKESGYSYPSGHAMISIALYGYLIYFLYKNMKNKVLKIVLISLLSFIIIGIGSSRIYVGVHYPSDIIGGYTISLIILLLTIYGGNQYGKNDRK